MKITKTAEEVLHYERERNIANSGCNICPCCGETISFLEAIKNGNTFKRGVSSYIISVPIKKGWFMKEYKTVTRYHCNRCGAEWESEPY